MYNETFDEEANQYVITGPDRLERRLPADGVGLALRRSLHDDGEFEQYVVPFHQMTPAERIAVALEMNAFPT